jgi:chitodextrinase
MGLVVALPSAAHAARLATPTNVVPNPGFEQAGCEGTPIICGWSSYDVMTREGGTGSGFSMHLDCGPFSCYPNIFIGQASVSASSFCVAIDAGSHPASFRYDLREGDAAQLLAVFFQGVGCSGAAWGDSLSGSASGGWQEVTGTLTAPPGTQSALFDVSAIRACEDFCGIDVSFDDLVVAGESAPDAAPPETTITSAPSGESSSSSAAFAFAASEPASFGCSLDGQPFTACASPVEYSGLGAGPHTFRVRAADLAGNVDATPAERSWIVSPNAPPAAVTAFACSGLVCAFDGNGSSDADGAIVAYAWDFGDGTSGTGAGLQHEYSQPGTYTATLTVTDDDGAWSRDSATFAVTQPNAPPTAIASHSCAGSLCVLDGGGSSDADGAIVAYAWDFGDGTTASGTSVQHAYARPGIYTVTLSVTDDDGAAGNASTAVALITLTATGSKVKGVQRVDLAWTGSAGEPVDIYRDGAKIATVGASSYTDTLGKSGDATYVYRVCAATRSVCSSERAVTF